MDLVNWGGNYRYRAKALHEPESLDELRRIVARAASVRAIGTRHSFNGIGDAEELVSLARMPGGIRVDREKTAVLVPAGMTYGALAAELQREGLALHAMASLPHISVGGAIATGKANSRNSSLRAIACCRSSELFW